MSQRRKPYAKIVNSMPPSRILGGVCAKMPEFSGPCLKENENSTNQIFIGTFARFDYSSFLYLLNQYSRSANLIHSNLDLVVSNLVVSLDLVAISWDTEFLLIKTCQFSGFVLILRPRFSGQFFRQIS